MRVNLHQAKSELSKLVVRAQAGEEVIITRSGKPVIRLTPIREDRVPGSALGQIWISPDFDQPLPDELFESFEHG